MQQPLLFFDYITIICVMDIHVQTMIYDDNIQKWWYDENMWNTVNQLIEYHNINKNKNGMIVENRWIALVFDNNMLSKMITKMMIICFQHIELIYEDDIMYDYQITQRL